MADYSVLDAEERGTAIDAAAGEIKAKRGRPPGSKNRPKDEDKKANRQRYAGLVSSLFILLSFILAWFGYEYDPRLTTEEATEGAVHLEPLGERFTWLANLAAWIGGPIWFAVKISEHFHKKKEKPESAPAIVPSAQTAGGEFRPLAPTETEETGNDERLARAN